jgi:hypothetical protein
VRSPFLSGGQQRYGDEREFQWLRRDVIGLDSEGFECLLFREKRVTVSSLISIAAFFVGRDFQVPVSGGNKHANPSNEHGVTISGGLHNQQ